MRPAGGKEPAEAKAARRGGAPVHERLKRGAEGGRLAGRLIALGVTGSIAAYKTPELVRLLQAEGADVVALLSHSAARFVAPLALAALTRHVVEDDLLALLPDGRIGHIVAADSADVVVVAPATAYWLGAMANGLAGDVVTATCLATSAPVVVAPAMDGEMYAHPATRANVDRLKQRFGYTIVEPEVGPLASGQSSIGRLAALPTIVDAVVAVLDGRPVRAPDPADRPPAAPLPREADLTGRHVVVTAGGTVEPIDPVRSITNRSTGRMGVAVAEAALDRGARVTVIAGQVSVPLPERATIVQAHSTAQMRAALHAALGGDDGRAGFDALVMAAAVADFRPARPAEKKIPRGDRLTLELEATPDLLAEAARIAHGLDTDGASTRRALEPRPVLVGFAAETGTLERAAEKLRRKGVDLLVANDVAEEGSGFGTGTNRVTVFSADGAIRHASVGDTGSSAGIAATPSGGTSESWPLLTKREVADRLLDLVAARLDARDAARQTAGGSHRNERARDTVGTDQPRQFQETGQPGRGRHPQETGR